MRTARCYALRRVKYVVTKVGLVNKIFFKEGLFVEIVLPCFAWHAKELELRSTVYISRLRFRIILRENHL